MRRLEFSLYILHPHKHSTKFYKQKSLAAGRGALCYERWIAEKINARPSRNKSTERHIVVDLFQSAIAVTIRARTAWDLK